MLTIRRVTCDVLQLEQSDVAPVFPRFNYKAILTDTLRRFKIKGSVSKVTA